MSETVGVTCQICSVQRSPSVIQHRESQLVRGFKFLACNPCVARGMEPRHLIIMVGRSKGYKTVLEFIQSHKYVGPPITAKEILKP